MSSRPIGLAGGMNTYGYATGNPLVNFELFGLNDRDAVSLPNAAGAIAGSLRGNPAGTNEGVGGALADYAEDFAFDMGRAVYDFADVYADMMARFWHGLSHGRWVKQDLYFHCRANCRAA